MDQVKTFLRQCVKYRFWIAVGLSILFPVIGYFAFSGGIVEATTKRAGEIKAADGDVSKYTAPNQPVPDVTKVVLDKKEVLAKDVDATQRKLYELQEPLLRWPEVVEDKFRTWGRTYPANVDQGAVQAAINDYTIAYPAFVSRVYKTFQPWNPEDGTGIVYAPDEKTLIKPANFTLQAAPELGKVWAEQERLWVVTALLDVVAKLNVTAGAKDWDGAWVKEILNIDVGSLAAQDQQSLAKGVELEPAPPLLPDGAPPPEPDPAAAGGGAPGGMGGMMMSGMGSMGGARSDEVYFLKSEAPLPYKILPIMMTVRVDQNRLSEFLVALENSPMAIQVMEPEISKPATPVVKPVYGETSFGMGMMGMMGGRGMGMMPGGDEEMMRGGGAGGQMRGMRGSPSAGYGPMPGGGPGRMGGMGGGMAGASGGQGANLRGVDRAKERKNKEAAGKTKAAVKKAVDQYYNVVEVTVYGQARFYNTPKPPESVDASPGAGTTGEPAATPPGAVTPPAAVTPPGAATPPPDRDR